MDFDTSLERSHRRLVRRWREQYKFYTNLIVGQSTNPKTTANINVSIKHLCSFLLHRHKVVQQLICSTLALTYLILHSTPGVFACTKPPISFRIQQQCRPNTGSWEQQLKVTSMGAFGCVELWDWLRGTLQGINISHLGKRKFIFKCDFWWDMLVPWRVNVRLVRLCIDLYAFYVFVFIFSIGPQKSSCLDWRF